MLFMVDWRKRLSTAHPMKRGSTTLRLNDEGSFFCDEVSLTRVHPNLWSPATLDPSTVQSKRSNFVDETVCFPREILHLAVGHAEGADLVSTAQGRNYLHGVDFREI
jgi:hypothetical protein